MKRFKLIASQKFLIQKLAQSDDLDDCALFLGVSNSALKKRIKSLCKKFYVEDVKGLICKLVSMQLLPIEVVNKSIYYNKNTSCVENWEIPLERFKLLTTSEEKYLFLVSQGYSAKDINVLMKLHGVYHCRTIRNSICCKLKVSRIKLAAIHYLRLLYR